MIVTYDRKNMFIVQATEQPHRRGTLEGLPNTFFFGFTKMIKNAENVFGISLKFHNQVFKPFQHL
jgi:hypothetical protein